MASKQVIAAKIAGLAVIYRPNMSAAECRVLCTEYHESLLDLSDEQFLQGVVEAKKICRFLPTPADIRKGYESTPPSYARSRTALPELEMVPEMWRQQEIMAKLFRRSLEGDLRAKEFFSGRIVMGSPEWEEKAREVLGAACPPNEPDNGLDGLGSVPENSQANGKPNVQASQPGQRPASHPGNQQSDQRGNQEANQQANQLGNQQAKHQESLFEKGSASTRQSQQVPGLKRCYWSNTGNRPAENSFSNVTSNQAS